MKKKKKNNITMQYIRIIILVSLCAISLIYFFNIDTINSQIGGIGNNCENITYPNKKDTREITFNTDTYNIPDQEGIHITVYRKVKIMHVRSGAQIIREYKVNLRNELDDRIIREDNQTPIGSFFIEQMEEVSSPTWCRRMRLNTMKKAKKNYTNAYENGKEIIQEFEKENNSIESDQDIRVFNTINSGQKMLRGIGIHGGGIGILPWTVGCIAMDDDNIIELYKLLQPTFKKQKKINISIL